MAAGFKTATVNASDVPATQTNFPSYVDLSRLGITTLAEAQSVRVYADSGKTTEWAREIVSATEMHVKVPSLTSTTPIYVDWDGVRADYAVTDTYGRNAVWSGYVGVWHYEHSSGNVTDSTGNGNTLTNIGTATFVTGKLGKASATNGTNQGFDRTTANGLTRSNTYWWTWWARSTNTNTYIFDHATSSGGNTRILAYYDNTNKRVHAWFMGNEIVSGNNSVSQNTWHKISITKLGGIGATTRFYLNGSLVGSGVMGSGGSSYNELSFSKSIDEGSWFSGNQDEARVATTEFSANWEITEYNNQSDEPGFWGTWSTVGGGNTFIPHVVGMV